MRNNLITVGLIAVAALVIIGLYWYQPAQVVTNTGALPGGAPAATTTPAVPQTIAFRVIATGANAANAAARKNVAVYTQAEYQKLWTTAHGSAAPARPAVDFSKEYVIGVFAGSKPTGGYAVAVTSIIDTGTARTITVTLAKPGTSCIVTQALTSPFELIAVPLKDVTHTSKNVDVATDCS